MNENSQLSEIMEKKRVQKRNEKIFSIVSSIIAIAAIVFILMYFIAERFPGLGTMLLAAVIAMLAVRNIKNAESSTLVTVILFIGSLINVAASVLQWTVL